MQLSVRPAGRAGLTLAPDGDRAAALRVAPSPARSRPAPTPTRLRA